MLPGMTDERRAIAQPDGTVLTKPVPRNAAGRMVRGCDVCRQVDDHPRHVVHCAPDFPGAMPSADALTGMLSSAHDAGLDSDAIDAMLAEQIDPTTVVRHPDCCRDNGCHDQSCRAMLDRHGGKTRDPLVKALEAETKALDGPKRDEVLAKLPRQGLSPQREAELRDEQRRSLQSALDELEEG